MLGADLILFLGGSVGATALILWIVLRCSRTRSQPAVTTAHPANIKTLPPLIDPNGIRAFPAPVDAVDRDCRDEHLVPGVEPSINATRTGLGPPDGEERRASPEMAMPGVAAQLADGSSENALPAPASHENSDACATGAVATAPTADDCAGITDCLPTVSEEPKFDEISQALLPVEDREELADFITEVVGDEGATPSNCESAGAKASGGDGPDFCAHLLPPSPEEIQTIQDDVQLAEAIGDPGSRAIPPATNFMKVFTAADAPSVAVNESHRDKEEPSAQELLQPRSGASAERLPELAANGDDLETGQFRPDLTAQAKPEIELLSGQEEDAGSDAVPVARPRPPKPAQHRDRRGQRRPAPSKTGTTANEASSAPPAVLRAPAEARLRLMIHPVRRTVSISAVLARPAGYPYSVTLLLGAGMDVGAYGEDRYDDVDLEWTPSLLSGEVRLDSKEGYQWLRSSRRIHIFSEQADEQGLMSVGSTPLNSSNAVVCAQDDAQAVRSAAAACGSAELTSHDHWTGVPEGWTVLSGYRPQHAAPTPLEPHLTTLDPGVGTEIRLSGGLQVRAGSFAQGNPPRIEIQPFPVGAKVIIDGTAAEMNDDGCWRAEGWEAPGDHLVDVVPGPSLTYRIVGDPWMESGWGSWDAHPDRFGEPNDAPWARAQICGASVTGSSGEHVVAAEAMPSVIALGLRRGMAMLRARPDAPVSVGFLRELPAFLISSSGPRRIQGRVDWLFPPGEEQLSRLIDLAWVAAVRSAASRRLPLSTNSPTGQEAWRRARARARRYRKAGA